MALWTLRKNRKSQNLPKSLLVGEIMVIVCSFGHIRHLFIQKSIQNLVQSGKMGRFELWAFKVWSKSYVVWTWPKYGQGNHHIFFLCPNTVYFHYKTPVTIMTHIYTYKWPIYIYKFWYLHVKPMGIKTHAVAMATKNHQKNKTANNTESSNINRFSISLHQKV